MSGAAATTVAPVVVPKQPKMFTMEYARQNRGKVALSAAVIVVVVTLIVVLSVYWKSIFADSKDSKDICKLQHNHHWCDSNCVQCDTGYIPDAKCQCPHDGKHAGTGTCDKGVHRCSKNNTCVTCQENQTFDKDTCGCSCKTGYTPYGAAEGCAKLTVCDPAVVDLDTGKITGTWWKEDNECYPGCQKNRLGAATQAQCDALCKDHGFDSFHENLGTCVKDWGKGECHCLCPYCARRFSSVF